MEPIKVTDEAELRNDVRQLYRSKGFNVCIQAVYEMIIAIQIFLEILKEEMK